MKNTSKVLALVLIVMTVLMSLSAITASAASTKVVNISDLTITTTTDDELVAGTGIYASAGLSIDSNSKSLDGFEFTKRLKLGGTMKVDSGVVKAGIKVVVDAPSKIVLYAMSGSSSADRVLQLTSFDGSALTELATADAPGASLAKCEFEVEAGTYYIGSKSSGINVYYIAVETLEVCEHSFEDGVCTLCGAADPNACQHTNKSPATCTDPEKCLDCGAELSTALGHTEGEAPTCDTAQTCTVCGKELTPALGHTLTFVNTLPTAEAAGKTIADCSVCNEHIDFGEVKAMTPGTYVLDAAALEGIAQYSLYDGCVKVVDGVFACHLSYKYRTDANAKTFSADDWVSTHRMNFGGTSEHCNNGEGEEAVPNGGLKNFVQIVTTGTTTLTFHWGVGDKNREIGVYDAITGELVAFTEFAGEKNALAYSTLEVPAGSYLIGAYIAEGVSSGGNYFYKITVDVVAPHTHDFSDATCTEAPKCECGVTEGEALGHDYVDGACTRCDAADPDYVPEPVVEMNFFQKIIAFIMDLINKILAIFKR